MSTLGIGVPTTVFLGELLLYRLVQCRCDPPQGQGPKKVCITRQISSFVNSLLCYIKFGTSIMTLHGHFTKITKKTKHGNVYNDRSTEKNNSQKHGFWTFARSLYKFPCFVFLVVL